MEPDKKESPAGPKSDPPGKEIKEKPTPPEEQPIREPEIKPEVEPSLPSRDLPGKENIPPIKDFARVVAEGGYW